MDNTSDEAIAPPARPFSPLRALRECFFASPYDSAMTIAGILFLYAVVPPILDFLVFDAVWTGEDRSACVGHNGACWAYVHAYVGQFVYGPYPVDKRWRVNVLFILLVALTIPMMIPHAPCKRYNAYALLFAFPVVAFVFLTGGRVAMSGFIWAESAKLSGRTAFWMDFLTVAAGYGIWAWLSSPDRTWRSALRHRRLGASVVIAIAATAFVLQADLGLAAVSTTKWGGFLITLVIAISSITMSLPIGILLALGRRSSLPVIRVASTAFIEIWRGVPLVTILFMSSVMLPLFIADDITVDRVVRVIVGITLFTSAYVAEVVRGGLQMIPKGQFEAARGLGLDPWQAMRLVILPQALRLVVPGMVNTFIGIFKDTSLVLIVGLFDLLGQVQASLRDPTWATPSQSHTGYIFAAIIFWVCCFGMSRYSLVIERRIAKQKY